MKRKSELYWDFGVVKVAFAGGFTLLSSFLTWIPLYVYALLFVAAFIFMIISFGIRVYENQHPVTVMADLLINTLDSPKFEITVGFVARDKVNIRDYIWLRLPNDLENKLRKVASYPNFVRLQDEVIRLEAGGYIELTCSVPIDLNPNCTRHDIESINFVGSKTKLGWSMIGCNETRTKMDCHYMCPLDDEDIGRVKARNN